MWSRENVALCAERQKNILESAAKMLAPDGYLTYSTCTFSPEENEGVIASFLMSHPEFELVDPSSPAVLSCIERGIVDRGEPSWISGDDIDRELLGRTLRIFPHHADGEGHFAALLHKSNDEKDAVISKRKQKEKKKGSKRKSCDRDSNRLTSESAYEAYEAFSKDVTKQTFEGVPCLFGDQLYLCPREIADIKDGLRILRCGLHLGSVVGKDRFEPSHALALALDVTKTERTFSVDITSARAYLHGDTLPCGEERGWYLITLDGFALGWGKASGGVMKNHYPKGLRKPQ
jgi:NOL1/NOP2/fmu family ribosome biogenesis protein